MTSEVSLYEVLQFCENFQIWERNKVFVLAEENFVFLK